VYRLDKGFDGMKHLSRYAVGLFGLILAFTSAMAPAQTPGPLAREVLSKLNEDDSIKVSEDAKCYKILFGAYLELSKPPFEVGAGFNLNTIHPKMPSWSAVSGWAESNAKMAQAILNCRSSKITVIGLPYGKEGLDQAYIKADIYCDVTLETMQNTTFPYQHALDTIAAFATAEVYRLMEAGQTQPALDLAMAHMVVLRMFCDREFLAEKIHSIQTLSDALSNLRDVMYLYQDKITAEQYQKLSLVEIPFLRPDRARLFMPEADRVVADALIKELFDERTGQADPQKFTLAFAELQSRHLPLTRFGAAKRWALVAQIHSSREDSLKKLNTIYDDWWRRWRVYPYDDILVYPTEFERTNQIRYAAVLFSIQDVEKSFDVRFRLMTEVNGTAMAAGLCAYKKTFNTYPAQTEKTYTQFNRRRSDSDPYEKSLGPLRYRPITTRHAINTPMGSKVWIEPGECVLYGQGQDHTDNAADTHTDDGSAGDMVMWPPIKSLYRAQGLME
jgi:hypothetical protein